MGKFKPKLILLESNDVLRDHAKSVLTQAGWDVFCHQVSQDALNMLEQSKEYLFALFISNFKLPKMDGDDILEKVKSISPVTRRMLIVPVDRTDILINAVNKAEIHACITFPFKDEDLVSQAANCFKQFKTALKRQRLKRVTAHQNKQMFQIAQKLKKKDEANKELAEMKKAKKLALVSKIAKAEKQYTPDIDISLSDVLEKKGIKASPEAFKNEFLLIFHTLKDLFDKVALRRQSEPLSLDLKDILVPATEKGEEPLSEDEPVSPEIMGKILKAAFRYSAELAGQAQKPLPEWEAVDTEKVDHVLDPYFNITVTDGGTKAYIEKIKEFDDFVSTPTTADLLDLLRQKQISYGIIEDIALQGCAIALQRSRTHRRSACVCVGAREDERVGSRFRHATAPANHTRIGAGRSLIKDKGGVICNISWQGSGVSLKRSRTHRRSACVCVGAREDERSGP